jgi:O-antigen/teichoic acid export membrane protein
MYIKSSFLIRNQISRLFFIKGFTQFLSFFAFSYLSQNVSKNTFSDFLFYLSIIEIVYAASRLGIPEYAINRYYNQNKNFNQIEKDIYTKILIVSIFVQIISLIIYLFYFDNSLLIILLSIGLLSFCNTAVDYNILKNNLISTPFYTSIRWINARSILMSLMIIFLVLMDWSNLYSLLLCYIISYILLLSNINIKISKINFSVFTRTVNLKMIATTVIQSIGAVIAGIDFYLIKKYFENSAYDYSISLKLMSFIVIIGASLSPYQAKLFHQLILEKMDINFFLRRTIMIFLIMFVVMVFAFAIATNNIYSLKMFFYDGINVSNIFLTFLVIPKLFEVLGGASCSQLMYMGYQRFLLIISFTMLFLKFALLYLFIDLYGVYSIYISTAVALSIIYIGYVIKIIFVYKEHKIVRK